MERRQSRRIPYFLDAQMVSETNTYDGTIGNVSEKGIECLMASENKRQDTIAPHKKVKLNFQIPSGDEIILRCKVVWVFLPPIYENTIQVGMEIMSSSLAYRDFINNLEC